MAIETLCPPALIYLIFSVTQIMIDTSYGMYNTALMKFIVTILFTSLLNYLCIQGLGTISWIIVFIPFILMTLIITLLLLMFGMHPTTGKLNIHSNTVPQPKQPDARMDVISKQKTKSEPHDIQDKYYDSATNTTIQTALHA